MRSIDELCALLKDVAPHEVVSRAGAVLMSDINWSSLVYDHLKSISDSDLTSLVLAAHISNVQPRVFMIAEVPGHARIILHHFDRSEFDAYFLAKKIGPHFHHFDFATRIIRGSYFQWLFHNNGELRSPDLSFDRVLRCDSGTVYEMPYDRYHCVMDPLHDTMSLMVRGPAVNDPGHLPEFGYGRCEILALRARFMEILRVSDEARPSRKMEI